jgi:hypothetical protein
MVCQRKNDVKSIKAVHKSKTPDNRLEHGRILSTLQLINSYMLDTLIVM